jgi:hypothetical protein
VTGITYPDRSMLHYRYDAGRVDSMWQTETSNVTFLKDASYLPTGQPDTLWWGNGTREQRAYDGRGLVTEAAVRTSSGPTAYYFRQRYGYDDRGNLVTRAGLTEALGTTRDTTVFGYDNLGRLTSALEWLYKEDEPPYRDTTWMRSYEYDRIGNRLELDTVNHAVTYVYESGTSRIDSTHNGTVVQYGHDADGNLTARANDVYTWTDRGEMGTYVNTGTEMTWSYVYDGLGRRVRKGSDLQNQRTYFLYDPSGRLTYELVYDPTQHPKERERERRNYYYLGNRPVGMRDYAVGEVGSPTHDWIVTDHLATPWKVLSSTASTRWSGTYYPFGILRTESGSTRRGNLRSRYYLQFLFQNLTREV